MTFDILYDRDKRLFNWLRDRDGQKMPAYKIARAMNCHEHTARAMLDRLESAGWIRINRSTRGGHRIELLRGSE